MDRTNPVLRLTLRTIAEFLLAVALFTLPIAFSVLYATTSAAWWERGFEKYDATRRTGLSQTEVLRVAEETRDYLTNDQERLTVAVDGMPFYSEREVQHMVDVKVLMTHLFEAGWAALGYLLLFLAAAALLLKRQAPRALAASFLRASLMVGALAVILGLIGLADFDAAFRQFHLLFFTNDLWQLSSQDRLIQLFPQGFFADTTLLIGGVTLGFLVLVGLSSFWYLRRSSAVGR